MSPKPDGLRASAEHSPLETLGEVLMSHNGCSISSSNQIQPHSSKEQIFWDLLSSERHALEARFWSKVQKTESCWRWSASTARGYGQFALRVDGRLYVYYTHRLAWMFAHGPIPDGLKICHNCPEGDDPLCVRASHLFLGTQPQNLDDARRKGRLVDGLGARKLSDAAYRDILTPPYRHGSGVALAAKYGVTKLTISRIRHGRQGLTYHAGQAVPFRLEAVPFRLIAIRGEVA